MGEEGEELEIISEDKSKWLIVYCQPDLSFSLIERNEAIFDEELLSLGDKLKFIYNGKEYDGEVRALGGDDDYDSLLVKLKDLNATNKKRKDSFHADRPRRNRGRGIQDAINSLVPQPRSKKPSESTESGKAKAGMLPTSESSLTVKTNNNSEIKKVIAKGGKSSSESSSSDNLDSESASSSHASSPLPEERSLDEARIAAQVKRKGREEDIKILKKLKFLPNSEELHRKVIEPKKSVVFGQSFAENNFTSSDSEDGNSVITVTDGRPSAELDWRSDTTESNSWIDMDREALDKTMDEQKKKKNSDKKRDKNGDKKKDKHVDKKKDKDGDKKKDNDDDKKKDKDGDKKKDKDDDKKKDNDDKKKYKDGDKKNDNDDDKKKDTDGDKKKDKQDDDKKRDRYDDDNKKDHDKKEPKDKKRIQKHSGKVEMETQELDFQVFRWSAVDEDVEEVCGRSKEIYNKKNYVSSDDFSKAKTAKNAQTFARCLLEAAFTDEALLKCSISGGQYRAGEETK